MSTKCHVWMAPGWQVKTHVASLVGGHVFGLLARFA
jgi:hypothetical protein